MKEYKYKINGENYNVTINEVGQTTAQVEVNGVAYSVEWEKPEAPKPVVVAKPAAPAAKPAAAAEPKKVEVKAEAKAAEVKESVNEQK